MPGLESAPTPPPASTPLRPAAVAALVVFGVSLGLALTLYTLRPIALAPKAPAPPQPAGPPTSMEVSKVWEKTRRLAQQLQADPVGSSLLAAAPSLREEYASAEAWAAAVGVLRSRLTGLPETPGPDFEVHTRRGESGSQDIVTAYSSDGGSVSLFFEGDHLAGLAVGPSVLAPPQPSR